MTPEEMYNQAIENEPPITWWHTTNYDHEGIFAHWRYIAHDTDLPPAWGVVLSRSEKLKGFELMFNQTWFNDYNKIVVFLDHFVGKPKIETGEDRHCRLVWGNIKIKVDFFHTHDFGYYLGVEQEEG